MAEQKVTILTLLIMLILVSVISVLGTTYLVVKLGLVQYPGAGGTSSSTGIVTLNVVPPSEIIIQDGKVLVNVVNKSDSGGSASPP